MKEQPRTQVKHFQNTNFEHKMKRLQISQKLVYGKFDVHEQILRTRNCRRKFIKNLLPEKRKENMQTKQPRFKSRLNNHAKSTLIEHINNTISIEIEKIKVRLKRRKDFWNKT